MKRAASDDFDAITRGAAAVVCALVAATLLGGCAIATAVGTTASLAVGTIGLAANTTIGVAKVTGKAIGTAAGALTPGDQ